MTDSTRRSLAALAMVALISGACSKAPASSGISSTGTPSNGGATAANLEQGVKFSQCMRAHGVSQFPDPDASGQLTIDGVVNGSSIDPNSPTFEQALTACKGLEPSGFTGQKRSPQQQEAALKFAQCMRESGVTDFPDPTPDSPLIDTTRIPSASGPGGMGILHAAMQKCRGFATAAGVTGSR